MPEETSIWSFTEKEEFMKKTWTKPTMCTVAVGMEMSRYFPAQLKAKK